MTGWTLKRFWKTVEVGEDALGHTVLLDGRTVRTPAKAVLALPTRALAEALAEEWARQEGAVDPRLMPLTRLANSAIDTVVPQFDEVASIVAAYGETDLLCYRAEGPEALRALQAEAWDPLLDWAATRHGARLAVTSGILPVPQEPDATGQLARAVRSLPPFELAAMHELVSLTGSLVLGLAVAAGVRRPEEIWNASRIDEDWQASQWGRDDEAEAASALKKQAFLLSLRFLELARAVP